MVGGIVCHLVAHNDTRRIRTFSYLWFVFFYIFAVRKEGNVVKIENGTEAV